MDPDLAQHEHEDQFGGQDRLDDRALPLSFIFSGFFYPNGPGRSGGTDLGLSNVDQAHLSEAQAIAPVAAIQNLFDPANADQAALAEHAAAERIAFVPFGPLGSGQGSARDERYTAVARRHGATAAQVALAHALALSPNVLAIPGTGSLAHLEENIGDALSAVREFAAAVLKRLDGEPVDMLILNAGAQFRNTSARSADGFELAFAVNHLAHYLLAGSCSPQSRRAGGSC